MKTKDLQGESGAGNSARFCPDCGRDMDVMGEYSDWVHYRPNSKVPCFPPEPTLCEHGCTDLWKDIGCPVHLSDKLRQQWCDAMNGKTELPRVYGIRFIESPDLALPHPSDKAQRPIKTDLQAISGHLAEGLK